MRRTDELIEQYSQDRVGGRGRDNRRDGSGRRQRPSSSGGGDNGRNKTRGSSFSSMMKSGLSLGTWFLAQRYVGGPVSFGLVSWQVLSAVGIQGWYHWRKEKSNEGQEWHEFFEEAKDAVVQSAGDVYDELAAYAMIAPLLIIFLYRYFSEDINKTWFESVSQTRR